MVMDEIAKMTIILDGKEVETVKKMINDLREQGHDVYVSHIEIETIGRRGLSYDR